MTCACSSVEVDRGSQPAKSAYNADMAVREDLLTGSIRVSTRCLWLDDGVLLNIIRKTAETALSRIER